LPSTDEFNEFAVEEEREAKMRVSAN